ncbi:hypothetical protein [Nocardiopsis alba]|uniref:hypothetical protein n=1 Tax=Nocardiopsis alba TaxID=53437 RepID=UPI0033AC6A15
MSDETMLDPEGLDDSQMLELEAEDEPGFVQIGHWVLFNYHLSPVARALYGVMAGYVNRHRRRRGDTQVWPTLPMLAILIGVGTGDQVTPYLDELVQVGAIVRRSTYDPKGRKTRNRYGVKFNPPRGHTNRLDVIMAHLRPIADGKTTTPDGKTRTLVQDEAQRTKEIIKVRREQAKTERASGLAGPVTLALPPYPLTVPAGNGKTAGHGVPEKTRVRTPENSGTYPKKLGSNDTQVPTTGSREREEGEDARAREDFASEGWGVSAGKDSSTPSAPEPSQAARAMIAATATRLGEPLSPAEHQTLAAKYDAAVAVINSLAASGADVAPSHLAEYIDVGYVRPDGTRTYDNLYAVLKHRLSESEVRAKLPGFVARQAASEASGTSGAWGVGTSPAPRPAAAPSASPNRCRIHGTRYIPDRSGHGLACPACATDDEAPAEATQPDTPTPALDKLLPPATPENPYGEHCGNNACNREQRTILHRSGDHVWAVPCPVCRPEDKGPIK